MTDEHEILVEDELLVRSDKIPVLLILKVLQIRLACIRNHDNIID